MANTAVQRVSSVVLEVRHPLWTPRSPGGETPIFEGTGSAPQGGWQPVGIGEVDHVVGSGANTVTYKGDAGLAIKLSGQVIGDMIEDHTGDGDAAVQMRSHRFEVPENRTLEFDATLNGRWLNSFVYTVFDDPTKRPFDLRETYTNKPALETALVNGASVATDQPVLPVDGDLTGYAVADLITIESDTTNTVYRIVSLAADSFTLDKPLVEAPGDDKKVMRAELIRRIECPYLIGKITDRREPKGILGMTVDLVAETAPTRTGLSS